MEKPLVVEVLADNGEHSHWTLIDTETGKKLWSEDPEECKSMGYPVECVDCIDGICNHDDLPPIKCPGDKKGCPLLFR
jgi:hypothetical protein